MLQKLKQFKEIVIDYESVGGNSTITVKTDQPGGALATRALPSGGTLPTTTTRQEITIPLDGLEGTLVQVEIAPNAGATLRLYGGFLRYRVVGVFLRSSMGEKWVSLPMGLAS